MDNFLNDESFCPECGYCNYEVIEKASNIKYKLAVGKCDENTCDFSVHDFETGELVSSCQFDDLQSMKRDINGRYSLVIQEDCNCE